MIEDLPIWIEALFILMTAYVIWFFYIANGKPITLLIAILFWSTLQSVLAYTGFYLPTDTSIPRFAFVLLPIIVLFIYALSPSQLQWTRQHRDLKKSTLLHTVRIGVEIVLFYLFVYKMVPELMTFEGRNFDILVGLTAPVIGYLFIRQHLKLNVLLIWNVVGLCLVSFIFINGLLSAELPFQQFGFDQPNRAIIYFPFILLPAVIVPLVIYTHVTDIIYIRSLMKNDEHNT